MQYNKPPDPGVILQLVNIAPIGPDTYAEVRALSNAVTVIGSSIQAEIGYWFFSGLLNGVNSGIQATQIITGTTDSEGMKFFVRFPGLFDLTAIWTLQAPRKQSCILGMQGGLIGGAIGQGQTMGGFTTGSIFIPQNDGAPFYPAQAVIASMVGVALTPNQVDLTVTTTAGAAVNLTTTGIPPWTTSTGASASAIISNVAGVLRLQYNAAVNLGDFLIMPAYTIQIRGPAGMFIAPTRARRT